MSELEPKDPTVPIEYGIDFHDEIVLEATRREFFDVGEILYYANDSGWYYEVTTAGKTSAHYPSELPREEDETLQDGSVSLVCKHPDSVSLPTVSSATWDVPTGITLSSQRESGLKAFITLSGGTDGEDYEITCHMTPSAGNPIDKTITVQVRAQ